MLSALSSIKRGSCEDLVQIQENHINKKKVEWSVRRGRRKASEWSVSEASGECIVVSGGGGAKWETVFKGGLLYINVARRMVD